MGGVSITKGAKSTMSVTINKTEVSLQKTKNLSVEVIPTNNQKVVLDKGVAGQGVPVGGLAGQFLRKINGSNYATEWYTLGTMSYQNSTSVAITGGSIYGITERFGSPIAIDFNIAGDFGAVARLNWNNNDGTLDLGLKGGNVSLQIGQELLQRVYNRTGSPLVDGQVVIVDGSQGQRLTVRPALANSDLNSATILGVVTEPIADNSEGFVTVYGLVRGVNTAGIADGTILWLSPTTAGAYTATKPVAPNHLVMVGYVVKGNSVGGGSIYVHVQNGYELDELHDVLITSPATNDVLRRNGSGLWVNYHGASGSFTSQDGKTITVVGGMITSIV